MAPSKPTFDDATMEVLLNIARDHLLSNEQVMEVVTEGYKGIVTKLHQNIDDAKKDMAKEGVSKKDLRHLQDRIDKDTEQLIERAVVPLVKIKQAGLAFIVHEDKPDIEAVEKTKTIVFGTNDGFQADNRTLHPTIMQEITPDDLKEVFHRIVNGYNYANGIKSTDAQEGKSHIPQMTIEKDEGGKEKPPVKLDYKDLGITAGELESAQLVINKKGRGR